MIILWKEGRIKYPTWETTEIEPSLIEALPELEYTEILLQLFYHYCFGPLECYVMSFFPTRYTDEMNCLHNVVHKTVISGVFSILFLSRSTVKQMHLS